MNIIANITTNGVVSREVEILAESATDFIAQHYAGSLYNVAREKAISVAEHFLRVRGIESLDGLVIQSPTSDKQVEVIIAV